MSLRDFGKRRFSQSLLQREPKVRRGSAAGHRPGETSDGKTNANADKVHQTHHEGAGARRAEIRQTQTGDREERSGNQRSEEPFEPGTTVRAAEAANPQV